jgi:hypothetical protein
VIATAQDAGHPPTPVLAGLDGRAESLTLRQNDRDLPAVRIA